MDFEASISGIETSEKSSPGTKARDKEVSGETLSEQTSSGRNAEDEEVSGIETSGQTKSGQTETSKTSTGETTSGSDTEYEDPPETWSRGSDSKSRSRSGSGSKPSYRSGLATSSVKIPESFHYLAMIDSILKVITTALPVSQKRDPREINCFTC